MKQKINEPLLVFNSVSSLDDAIDFANERSASIDSIEMWRLTYSSSSPLLALHVFAAPAEAKYLAQYIEASVSFVNHIPVPLLGTCHLKIVQNEWQQVNTDESFSWSSCTCTPPCVSNGKVYFRHVHRPKASVRHRLETRRTL